MKGKGEKGRSTKNVEIKKTDNGMEKKKMHWKMKVREKNEIRKIKEQD